MQNRYKALQDERAKLIADSKAMFVSVEKEARDLTDEEKRRDDETTARLEILAGEIQREDRRRAWEQNLQALPDEPTPTRITGGHDRALDKPWGADNRAPFGEFLQAIHRARTGMAFDPRLQMTAVAQGAGEAIGADGGFLVQTDMVNDISLRLTGGEILSRLTPIPIGPNSNGVSINVIDESSRVEGSRFGAVQGYWVDEGTSITASRPRFHKVELKLKKVAALGYATDELLADAGALQAVMTEAFAQELLFRLEDSIINGTGAGQPQGILTAASLVSVAKETGQAAATIVFENILKMWARIYAPLRRNAIWLINQDIEPQLYSMSLAVGTGGVPVYLPANGLSASPYGTLFGRPVVPVEYCQTLGTKGDIYLAAFSEYAYINKGGVQPASSMHVAFATDEMAFRATLRVDGQPKWRTALVPFKGTNNQAPFISLDTRA